MSTTQPLVTFTALATAAYCPRKLHYARREDDRSEPDRAADACRLAGRYPDLLVASDTALGTFDLAVPPDTYRTNLERARRRYDRWPDLVAPAETRELVTGRDCRGMVDKILPGSPTHHPTPVLVSPGRPPDQGVWAPQGVRAVAAAKALSWREAHPVDAAFVEYPFHGVVRRVQLTTRRRASIDRRSAPSETSTTRRPGSTTTRNAAPASTGRRVACRRGRSDPCCREHRLRSSWYLAEATRCRR